MCIRDRFLRKRTDGTPGSWVGAVYEMVLGRAPDPGGLAFWTQRAAALGPKRTAARLIASPEARRFRIRTLSGCTCVLGGPPEVHLVTDGLADWASGGYDRMLARLLASDEVYLHTQGEYRTEPA